MGQDKSQEKFLTQGKINDIAAENHLKHGEPIENIRVFMQRQTIINAPLWALSNRNEG